MKQIIRKFMAFFANLKRQQLLVLTNFYDKDTRIAIPEGFTEANILIDNYSGYCSSSKVWS